MNQSNIYQSSDVNNIETFSCDGMNGIATKTNDTVATERAGCVRTDDLFCPKNVP